LALRAGQDADPDGLAFDFAKFPTGSNPNKAAAAATQAYPNSNRYSHLVIAENLRELDLPPDTIKNNVIKSSIVVSKFLGKHLELILYVCVS
jgi:hypothetical protein